MKIKTVIQQQQNMVLLVTYALYTHIHHTLPRTYVHVYVHAQTHKHAYKYSHTLSLCHT